ncbi:MAG: hypothetical protein HY298_10925 [Verrucomicrobia bacterium]|nr:hypothetical protein [Verrucomicrobiota bacterium]
MNPTLNSLEAARTARRRRLVILSLIVLVILVAGFFGAPPAYHSFTGWRSKRLAAQAERLTSQNQLPQAVQKAQAAFLLNRSEPAALHAMARALTAATNAAALPFWQQLSLTGQATDDDRRAFVELAMRTGALGLAADELRKLLASGPNQPVNLWLASQLYAALGDYAQTVNYATRARLHDPSNKQYQLFLASLWFGSSEPEQREEARKNVWSLAREESRIGLDALSFLTRRQDLTAEQRRELIALLKQNPLSGTTQQLLALDQRLHLEPDQRAGILDQALTQYKGADPATLAQFAVWLNQHEQFQRTLLALPLEAALKRKELFIPHLDALAALGRWEELDKILDTKQTPLEPVFFEGFRARCAMQLGKSTSAALHWNRALWYAERNPEQLTWLALYADKCGAAAPAKKACRSWIACAADVRPAYQTLQQFTAKSGTTEELRDLLGEMLKRWPADPALRNDHAYLNLLLAKDLSAARLTAEELVQQFPEILPYRTTLALACYRLKDYPAALRVYEGRHYDWGQALPGNRAVYAAVLAANGKLDEARHQARNLPRLQLRDEEFELIRSGF